LCANCESLPCNMAYKEGELYAQAVRASMATRRKGRRTRERGRNWLRGESSTHKQTEEREHKKQLQKKGKPSKSATVASKEAGSRKKKGLRTESKKREQVDERREMQQIIRSKKANRRARKPRGERLGWNGRRKGSKNSRSGSRKRRVLIVYVGWG